MITEPITWHVLADNPADLPDADLTVMIELDPASDYSEPVFMGSWDGDCWRDVHGVEVAVIAWADVPNGTAGVAPSPADQAMGDLLDAHLAASGVQATPEWSDADERLYQRTRGVKGPDHG